MESIKGGPRTPEGKKRSSTNSGKHYFRLLGLKRCYSKCPAADVCPHYAPGETCQVELEEFRALVAQLSEAYGLNDAAGKALAEVCALQKLRIMRGNTVLGLTGEGAWVDPRREYILRELRNLEAAFATNLAQLRKMAREKGASTVELAFLELERDAQA